MQNDYYQNILYPLQDKVLSVIGTLPVDFYLTDGTALSRAYLRHRYSDDLDFFVNNIPDFKTQVNTVIKALSAFGFTFETADATEDFARFFIFKGEHSLKMDFVNDVPFSSGSCQVTPIFKRTDNLLNILSNKVTALGRYSPKDVVDIVYICLNTLFTWENIFNDANKKDLWINPVNAAEVLEQFPAEKLQEIIWIGNPPVKEWFYARIKQIIMAILEGSENNPDAF